MLVPVLGLERWNVLIEDANWKEEGSDSTMPAWRLWDPKSKEEVIEYSRKCLTDYSGRRIRDKAKRLRQTARPITQGGQADDQPHITSANEAVEALDQQTGPSTHAAREGVDQTIAEPSEVKEGADQSTKPLPSDTSSFNGKSLEESLCEKEEEGKGGMNRNPKASGTILIFASPLLTHAPSSSLALTDRKRPRIESPSSSHKKSLSESQGGKSKGLVGIGGGWETTKMLTTFSYHYFRCLT